jgi:D-alanyl-lipoteichoic acid acyltransferase DltB (MBOAT superfamily)
MAWGFFQKVVIADRLARVASPAFDRPHENHGLVLLIGAVAFTFQIYFDFAGYSTIARGAAQVMGINLMVNFRSPYHATSVRDFWSRWHISLSTWFRDYLYIPLGGNRVSRARWYGNLMTVFLVSGFWHGASWNFLVWGGLHGVYLVTGIALEPHMPALLKDNTRRSVHAFNVLRVFVLVCMAFVFFRAATVRDALYILRHIPTGLGADLGALARRDVISLFHERGLPPARDWFIAAVGIALTQAVEIAQTRGSIRERLGAAPAWVRWPAYCALTYAIVCFASSEPAQFIYYQF